MSKSLKIITTNTPDGAFHILTDDKDTARASGFGSVQELIKRLPDELRFIEPETIASHPYQLLVHAYYTGDMAALNKIPYTQNGSNFQERVWAAISSIDYGKTMSYKQLATTSGNPAAVRATGTICGLNRLILLVPCHRVIKSDGGIGSYLYGLNIKESLLRHEGAIS